MVHEQAAGFVLDALDSEEAREFERHLQLCPDCEEELEPLRVAATALAFAGDLPAPPAALRRRVVLPRLRRQWRTPVVPVATLAACAALALTLTLTGTGARPHRVTLHLPPAPAGKVYELWFIRDGQAMPAGFGHAGRNEVRNVPRGAAVAVTLEPRGGSRRPTGPVLIRTETA